MYLQSQLSVLYIYMYKRTKWASPVQARLKKWKEDDIRPTPENANFIIFTILAFSQKFEKKYLRGFERYGCLNFDNSKYMVIWEKNVNIFQNKLKIVNVKA